MEGKENECISSISWLPRFCSPFANQQDGLHRVSYSQMSGVLGTLIFCIWRKYSHLFFLLSPNCGLSDSSGILTFHVLIVNRLTENLYICGRMSSSCTFNPFQFYLVWKRNKGTVHNEMRREMSSWGYLSSEVRKLKKNAGCISFCHHYNFWLSEASAYKCSLSALWPSFLQPVTFRERQSVFNPVFSFQWEHF